MEIVIKSELSTTLVVSQLILTSPAYMPKLELDLTSCCTVKKIFSFRRVRQVNCCVEMPNLPCLVDFSLSIPFSASEDRKGT